MTSFDPLKVAATAAAMASEVCKHPEPGKPATGVAPALQVQQMWDALAVAAYLGVSLRAFQKMRDAGLVPEPIVLGPRTVRWVPEEVRAAVLAMPRAAKLQEPKHLVTARQVRRARIEAMRAGVDASPDAVDAAVRKTIVKVKAPAWMASK